MAVQLPTLIFVAAVALLLNSADAHPFADAEDREVQPADDPNHPFHAHGAHANTLQDLVLGVFDVARLAIHGPERVANGNRRYFAQRRMRMQRLLRPMRMAEKRADEEVAAGEEVKRGEPAEAAEPAGAQMEAKREKKAEPEAAAGATGAELSAGEAKMEKPAEAVAAEEAAKVEEKPEEAKTAKQAEEVAAQPMTTSAGVQMETAVEQKAAAGPSLQPMTTSAGTQMETAAASSDDQPGDAASQPEAAKMEKKEEPTILQSTGMSQHSPLAQPAIEEKKMETAETASTQMEPKPKEQMAALPKKPQEYHEQEKATIKEPTLTTASFRPDNPIVGDDEMKADETQKSKL